MQLTLWAIPLNFKLLIGKRQTLGKSVKAGNFHVLGLIKHNGRWQKPSDCWREREYLKIFMTVVSNMYCNLPLTLRYQRDLCTAKRKQKHTQQRGKDTTKIAHTPWGTTPDAAGPLVFSQKYYSQNRMVNGKSEHRPTYISYISISVTKTGKRKINPKLEVRSKMKSKFFEGN